MISENILFPTVGDEGKNTLTGTSNNDTLEGLGGDDILEGKEGDDSLNGGSGNNTLNGGLGNDILVTQFGDINGDLGNDTLIADYSNYEIAITNIGWSNRIKRVDNDDDLIYFYDIESIQIIGSQFNDFLQGNANDILDGGEGIDKLSLDFSTETEPITIDLTNTNNQVNLDATQVSNFETIDTIYTGSNSDIIKLGLDSSISSGTVDGGFSDDKLILDYSAYETAIQNVESSYYVKRIDNDVDLIYFYNIESLQITGTEFADSLRGFDDNDTLIGGSGNDFIQGNANDILDGGEGIDKLSLDFSTETEPITIDLTNTNNQVNLDTTQVSNFETIDTIYTGSNSDIIKLGLDSSIANGTVDGGSSDDRLILDYSGYQAAIQNVESSYYVERIDNDVDLIYFYNIESLQLTGTEFADSLRGFDDNDTLIGGSGNDFIQGNSGDDVIVGANITLENTGIDEIDTLVGGANSDHFFLGSISKTFYNDGKFETEGLEDYALIRDFNPSEDTIELSGTKSNYRLDISPIQTIPGMAIYQIGNEEEADELIAIIEGLTELDMNSDAFEAIVSSIDNVPTFEITDIVASNNDDATMSLSFTNPEFINKIDFELVYDTILLQINDIIINEKISPKWELINAEIDTQNGRFKVNLEGNEPLTANTNLVDFNVNVPNNATYGATQTIVLESVKLNNRDIDVNSNNGVQVIVKSGDISKDGYVDGLDAYQIMHQATGLNHLNVNFPSEVLLGLLTDMNQDDVISAFDAYLALQV